MSKYWMDMVGTKCHLDPEVETTELLGAVLYKGKNFSRTSSIIHPIFHSYFYCEVDAAR